VNPALFLLCADELLNAFGNILSAPGDVTASQLRELQEIDAEFSRREAAQRLRRAS
jgi:hypothetical protein